MAIIRPRLNDYYNIPITQEEVDFAIPLLNEDIPFYLDPFLLWKSPSQQDQSLHTSITNSFNHLGRLLLTGQEDEAIRRLLIASECNEVGLGFSKNRIGKPIGSGLARDILSLFQDVPQIKKAGFTHFEEIQLLVNNVSKDRVSDISCSFCKSFLIDFTISLCEQYGIPMEKVTLQYVYNYSKNDFSTETLSLPINPETKHPIILVPKRWLRYIPWINLDDFYGKYYVSQIVKNESDQLDRVAVLNYNRKNYDVVQGYVARKENAAPKCSNDPLFSSIPVISANRKLSNLLKLNTGKEDRADRIYEEILSALLPSLFYPQLDFAEMQSRTIGNVQIRDLIFYNNVSIPFLKEIYKGYECKQIVMEMKNVKELSNTHVNQLNRYMKSQFGRFGIIITRNKPPERVVNNTIHLWSGQRKCILILYDEDMRLMCDLFRNKQRLPIDVINKRYVEFTRKCPG